MYLVLHESYCTVQDIRARSIYCTCTVQYSCSVDLQFCQRVKRQRQTTAYSNTPMFRSDINCDRCCVVFNPGPVTVVHYKLYPPQRPVGCLLWRDLHEVRGSRFKTKIRADCWTRREGIRGCTNMDRWRTRAVRHPKSPPTQYLASTHMEG